MLLLLEIIANKIQPPSPIAHWEKLKIAADEGFLLSTSSVKQLVGTKPVLKDNSTSLHRGSFIFTKAGKIVGQTAWKISFSQ